ncbi:MAG: ferrous iron transport protein A [Clostridiales bacterium]|jgi:Fe2+ transport system protein FeoA|nr:ferrous iron transport protein A [Clostridiales bacterium]
MKKKLSEFMPGEKGCVVSVSAEGKIRRRLFDMGVTPGARIEMIKTAPLGDPIEVAVRGYELSLRKSEAETVLLESSK